MRHPRLFSTLFAFFLLLTLTSCAPGGQTPEEAAEAIRAELSAAQTIQFTADISADYGDRVYSFGVSAVWQGDEGVITLSKPDIIAGVTVKLAEGGSTLSWSGAEVYTGEILPDGLSPVDAVPALLNVWREGLVTEAVRETLGDQDCLSVLHMVTDQVNARTWFTEATGLPLRAELIFDGCTVITCDFYNVKAE